MIRAVHARRVFIDTSAYFGLAGPNDAHHRTLGEIARRLTAERRQTFTSNFILAETHALALQRLGRAIAHRMLVELDGSNTILVRVSAADERRAREILAQYQDKDFSLTDATSFAIMERLRIGAAFTLDDHFAQYGFEVLSAK